MVRMGLFGKSAVPGWAKKLDAEKYSLLKHKLFSISGGAIDTEDSDKSGALKVGNTVVMLRNLVEQCSNIDQSHWDATISAWVQYLKNNDKPIKLRYPDDLDSLRLQIYPTGYFGDKKAIAREHIPGLITAIMVDLPDKVINLDPEANPNFAEHQNEIFSFLLSRLKPSGRIAHLELPDEKDGIFVALEGEDILTATQVLAFERLYPQFIGEHGVLLAIPNRHLIICKRLNAEPQDRMVTSIRDLVQSIFSKADHKLTNELFLLKNGKFSVLK